MLVRRGPTKPPAGALLNWAHPLAQGLLRFWAFNEGGGLPRDLVQGRPLTFTGSPVWAISPTRERAQGVNIPASGTYLVGDDDFRTQSTAAVTVLWSGFWTDRTLAGSACYVSDGQATSTGYNWIITDSGADTDAYFFLKTAGVGTSAQKTVPIASAGTGSHDLVGRYDGATLSMWVNGVSGTTTAKTGTVDSTDFDVIVGQWNSTAITQVVSRVAIWNRALSASEIMSLTTNPWAMLRPTIRILGFATPAVAGGVFTRVVSSGSGPGMRLAGGGGGLAA